MGYVVYRAGVFVHFPAGSSWHLLPTTEVVSKFFTDNCQSVFLQLGRGKGSLDITDNDWGQLCFWADN